MISKNMVDLKEWAEKEYQKQLDKIAGVNEEVKKVVIDPDWYRDNEEDR